MVMLPETLTVREATAALAVLETTLLSDSEPVLVIDGSQLKRFDSSSLAVLLACRRLAETWGKRFELRELPPQLRELAKLYGVDEILATSQTP
jgi:phospholipid transport system transporter-binding protein